MEETGGIAGISGPPAVNFLSQVFRERAGQLQDPGRIMNTQYLFEESPRLGIVSMEGKGSLDESLEIIKKVAADPRFDPDAPLLIDAMELTFRMSVKDAQSVAVTIGTLKTHFRGKIAITVSGDTLFGMARMISILMESGGFSIRAFRDSASARKWLLEGLSSDVSQEVGNSEITGTSKISS